MSGALLIPPLFDGSTIFTSSGSGGSGDVSSNVSSSLVGQVAVFASTTGKMITVSSATIAGNNFSVPTVLATNINTDSGPLNLGSATGVIQIGTGSIFSNKVAAGVFLNGRLTTDTFDKISLHTTSHLLMGSGTAAQDCRIWRSAATTITMDNNSTGAVTLASNAGTFSNFATWNRAGLMTLATSSNGAINISANGSGTVTLTSGTGNIIFGRPISTVATTDLTLNPTGTNIVCSSKNLTEVLSLQCPTISTISAADLSLNPSGTNINMNSKTLTNVNYINMNNTIGVLGTPRILLHAGYGLNIFNDVLAYEVTPTTANHIFYVGGVEKVRVNNTNMVLSVPLTSTTGNLVLNAAGSSIDCSGKSLINVGSISSTGRIFAYCSTTAVSNAVGTSQLLPNTVITGSNTFAANQLQQGQGFVMKMWFNISATVTTVNFQVNYNGQLIRSLVINGTTGDYYYELNIHLVAASGAANNVQSIGQLFQNGVASVIDTNANVVATPITYAAASSFSHQVSMTVTPPSSNFHLRRWSINSA